MMRKLFGRGETRMKKLLKKYQNRKPLKIDSSLKLVLLGASILLTGIASASPCSQCISSKRTNCGISCQNFETRAEFDSCSDNCVKKACFQPCGEKGVPKDSQLANPHSRCQKCLADQSFGACHTECSATTMNVNSCIKKCSQRACGEICDVTDYAVVVPQKSSKLECEMCQSQAKATCKTSPDCFPGQPGALACQLNCVTQTCKRKCTGADDE